MSDTGTTYLIGRVAQAIIWENTYNDAGLYGIGAVDAVYEICDRNQEIDSLITGWGYGKGILSMAKETFANHYARLYGHTHVVRDTA